jgi:hypothetical protein
MYMNTINSIEDWRVLPGYDGKYMVSNKGEVKSLNYKRTGKEKILSCSKDTHGYPQVTLTKNYKKSSQCVHNLVALCFIGEKPNGEMIDHINRIRDDNRPENLRYVTGSENQRNQCVRKGCSSRFKGVSWVKKEQKYKAYIRVNGRRKHLGIYSIEIDAAIAYDEEAKKHGYTTNEQLGLFKDGKIGEWMELPEVEE